MSATNDWINTIETKEACYPFVFYSRICISIYIYYSRIYVTVQTGILSLVQTGILLHARTVNSFALPLWKSESSQLFFVLFFEWLPTSIAVCFGETLSCMHTSICCHYLADLEGLSDWSGPSAIMSELSLLSRTESFGWPLITAAGADV